MASRIDTFIKPRANNNMTQTSFSADLHTALHQTGPLTNPLSQQAAKHKVLDQNSILLQINEVNVADIKYSIEEAACKHFESLRVPFHPSMFKGIETLQLEPGQRLVVKKEENNSISLSLAKERKIRIGKALVKVAHCLRSTPQPSERTSFGGLFGNRFITEKPAVILAAPTEAVDANPEEYSWIENNSLPDNNDDALSMVALADTSMDPPGELMQSHSFIYPSQPNIDPPGELIQSHSFIYPSQPNMTHYASPYASLPIINEGSDNSSDNELLTTALSSHVYPSGPGPELDTAESFSLKPPKLGNPKINSEAQELSSFIEVAYQQSKPSNRYQVAIAGHGSLDVNYQSFTLPPNVTLRTWRIPGQVLSDPIGKEIEDFRPGQSIILKNTYSDYLYETIFKSGEKMPDYMLYPPDGLNISHESVTVSKPTPLSEVIKDLEKNYHGTPIQIEFSACQSYSIPTFGVNEKQNLENLRLRLGITQRDVLAVLQGPRDQQNTRVLTYLREAFDTLQKDFATHKQTYNQQVPFLLKENTGKVIGSANYVDFILAEISEALGNPNVPRA
jgi:hypothetical protein